MKPVAFGDVHHLLKGRVAEDENGCWVWSGRLSQGYGSFERNYRHVKAHRFMWLTLIGPIPAGYECDHLCRNRACCRPSHIEIVTHAENVRRGLTGKVNHRNTRKTACKRGHPFDEANTGKHGGGRRFCRACENARMTRKYHENPEYRAARIAAACAAYAAKKVRGLK